MEMRIIRENVAFSEVSKMAELQFGEMIKAVVDVDRKIMALGGDLHADGEALLLEDGSKQENLWGINLYPGKSREEWIEFDSMINIRPSQGNRSRGVENERIRALIEEILGRIVQ
jgi:hypothetical protein